MNLDLDIYRSAIVAGDTHAFGQWMAGCEETIRLSLRSFARVVDVEAVLQESLLRVWQVVPRFVPDGRDNGLLRLAIRISRNLAVSELRKVKATPASSEDIEAALADDVPAPQEPDPLLRDAIADCREKLPDKPRAALDARLQAAGGDDDSDIAQSLGMKLNTFLQNFTRARKFLADCLGKRGITIEELGA
ncbi:MAG TPA: RNA polymerase sigma factor [Kofleriaceae bacterium]|jgi:RNA polymerase sigma-70 factor (ECF subfamily)